MEQLDDQLPSLETALSDEVLDRIDAIVPPGTNLNQSDAGWEPPAIADKRLRRR
jgi:aryl-alcohol dehydrogenase (NADP+)